MCEQLDICIMETLREFLETSTIHGIAHISTEKVEAIYYNPIPLLAPKDLWPMTTISSIHTVRHIALNELSRPKIYLSRPSMTFNDLGWQKDRKTERQKYRKTERQKDRKTVFNSFRPVQRLIGRFQRIACQMILHRVTTDFTWWPVPTDDHKGWLWPLWHDDGENEGWL